MSDSRRDFLKKAMLLSGAGAATMVMPASIQRALAINPELGSTFLDAEHIVILMQENRSFDHCFGTLRGVRGFNDPRAIDLPDGKPVWMQTNALGKTYAPFRLNIKATNSTWLGDLPHSRQSQVDADNKGKYDKWLDNKKSRHARFKDAPLTLGFYNREDLPFHCAMADAFTICDQNFSSAMTSTTPNRSFFWTGKADHLIEGHPKVHIRNTDFAAAKLPWKAIPEVLTDHGVKWRFYQNDIGTGGGYEGEERSWLANFGCNLLEFFEAYKVKFTPRYVQSLKLVTETLPAEIRQLQQMEPAGEAAAKKRDADIRNKQAALDNATAELRKWSSEEYDKLTDKQKTLFHSAFVNNSGDPDYRSLSTLKYEENGEERELTVPKGDVLFQFRKDVNEGKLPAVSWLAPSQKFSDHPSAPWYGAWFVSEILDILTKNPEVWKKTIFINTYDENDGYYDHVRPYSVPDNKKPGTGKVSAGIDTEREHVRLANELRQGVPKHEAREAPIGLGFRVPMIIASPWTKGGKVCSEIFDHTSTIQFLEHFFTRKLNKEVKLDNISEWRRTICGDLSSAFTPANSAPAGRIEHPERNAVIQTLYNSKFKKDPSGWKEIGEAELAAWRKDRKGSGIMPVQEEGTRPSRPLPYELYVDGRQKAGTIELDFRAGDQVFGKRSAGSPFTVYSPVAYVDETGEEVCRNWSFAVKPGDTLSYAWPIANFRDGNYHLRVQGPNGFYREFIGSVADAALEVKGGYWKGLGGKPDGKLTFSFHNTGKTVMDLEVADAYNDQTAGFKLGAGEKKEVQIDTSKNHRWYDLSVRLKGSASFERRYAGRVETGEEGISDPMMA